MILPNKYIPLSESLIGISSILLQVLDSNEMTIDELWDKFNKQKGKLKSVPTYNKFVLTINFMFFSNMINYTEKGVIYNENLKLKNI